MLNRLCPVLIAAFAFLASACTSTESDTHYIRLSDSSLSFNGAGNAPRTITIASNPSAWQAESSASWIKITGTEANTLTITVDDNDVATERKGIVHVDAGKAQVEIVVSQLPEDSEFARYRAMFKYENGIVMSPSGKYAGGFYATLADDGSLLYHADIVEVETDRVTELGPYPMSLMAFGSPSAITDQGQFFLKLEAGSTYMFDLDGTYSEIATPAGMNSDPYVSCVSADGSKWVGYSMKNMGDGHGSLYWPLIWENGTARELEMPKSYRGEEYTSAQKLNGVMARGISANGEIVYGTTWDNFDFGLVYWDKAGKVHYVGEDVREVKPVKMLDGNGGEYDFNLVDGIIGYASSSYVSPNGKWIAGTYRKEELAADRMGIDETYRAAFFNTETGKTYILEEYGDSSGLGVTDEGEGFVGVGSSTVMNGFVVDIETGIKLGTTQEWVYETFGIHVPACRLEQCCVGKKVVTGATPVSDAVLGMVDGYFYIAPAAGR